MATEENKTEKPVQKPSAEKKEKKDRKGLIIIILSILCAGLLGEVIYLMSQKQEVVVQLEKSESANVDLTEELTLLQSDYDNLETDNEELNTQMAEYKERIAEMMEEAEKHKDDAYIIAKLRKETKTLRKIMMGFVKDIDSLNTLNQNLIAENEQISENLNQETERATQLEADLKETKRKGSILNAQNVRATGVRFKSGGSKESETTKAKRAEQIKASFILGENRLADKGNKDVFLRILTPDGKELSSGMNDANRFAFNGVKGYFCAKQTIDYQNEELSMSLYAKNKAGFIPGTYKVEVYADEALIGHTTLVLN